LSELTIASLESSRLRLRSQWRRTSGPERHPPDETWHGYPKAATVAQNHIQQGFRGCWIMALGTN
jgi:hypothetical protein